jgi:hypothetical protein
MPASYMARGAARPAVPQGGYGAVQGGPPRYNSVATLSPACQVVQAPLVYQSRCHAFHDKLKSVTVLSVCSASFAGVHEAPRVVGMGRGVLNRASLSNFYEQYPLLSLHCSV